MSPTPLIALLLLAAQPAAGAPATAPAEAASPSTGPAADGEAAVTPEQALAAAREEARRLTTESHARLRRLEPIPMADLLEAEMLDGLLVVRGQNVPEQGRVLQPFTDRPGEADVFVRPAGQAMQDRLGPAAEGENLQAVRVNYWVIGGTGEGFLPVTADGAPLVVANTFLVSGPIPGQMRLDRTEETAEGHTNINFGQYPMGPATAAGDVPVRLSVSRVVDDPDVAPPATETYEADTFEAFRRQHPDAFRRHVRPMLLEMGLGSVVDAQLREAATQLYLAELPTDEATAAEVRRLVAALEGGDFASREAAAERLAGLGRPGASEMARLAAAGELTPQQSTRVAVLLETYQPLPAADAARLAGDAAFLRDVSSLEGGPDDAALRDLAAARLGE